jgi:hypothetical protein
MNVFFPKHRRPVVAAKGDVKPPQAKDLVDDPEVIHHLQTPRLKPLALGSDKVSVRLVDDPEPHVAAGKIASQRQPGGPGACYQNWKILVVEKHVSPIRLFLIEA